MVISEKHSAAVRENIKKAQLWRRAHPVVSIERACEGCGKIMLLLPSRATNSKRFCSRPCRYATMRGAKGANAGGGDWMKGAGNPNWKDGVSQERTERERHNAERQQWRRRVFARDANTCQHCGFVGRNRDLQAHHVKEWAAHPDLRNDVSNGITLCKPCHDKIHYH